jgi:hypothetical protein
MTVATRTKCGEGNAPRALFVDFPPFSAVSRLAASKINLFSRLKKTSAADTPPPPPPPQTWSQTDDADLVLKHSQGFSVARLCVEYGRSMQDVAARLEKLLGVCVDPNEVRGASVLLRYSLFPPLSTANLFFCSCAHTSTSACSGYTGLGPCSYLCVFILLRFLLRGAYAFFPPDRASSYRNLRPYNEAQVVQIIASNRKGYTHAQTAAHVGLPKTTVVSWVQALRTESSFPASAFLSSSY